MKKINYVLAVILAAMVLVGCASTGKQSKPEVAAANFTRDYSRAWFRIYSVDDYLAGVYRPNFRNIPRKAVVENGEEGVTITESFELDGVTLYLDWGEKGNFLALYSLDNGIRAEYIYENIDSEQEVSLFQFDELTGLGVETEVTLINGKKYVIAAAGRNTNYDGFRLWVEDSVSMEAAEKTRDSYGLTNYDYIDVYSGVYKPGYKRLWGDVTTDSKYTGYYDMEKNKTYLYNYNGTEFLVGSSNDVSKSVRTLDGKVIPPVNNFIKFKAQDKNGKKMLTLGYGWEGKVKLGGESVTMALCMCNGQIRVFVKE